MTQNQQNKPSLLVVSDILPFPKDSGQSLRVFYTLLAAKEVYNITFLTINDKVNDKNVRTAMDELCNEIIYIKASYKKNTVRRLFLRAVGEAYCFFTGLKFSNFINGRIEFTGERIAKAIGSRHFDLVLYEYWHAWKSTSIFRDKKIPCLLDTHNILWQSYIQQYQRQVPGFVRKFHFNAYRTAEENSWNHFDGIIGINNNEYTYIKDRAKPEQRVFLIEMGIDITQWPYEWELKEAPSFTYYGSLGTQHNKESALLCAQKVMPVIWAKYPNAQLWIIGSKPDADIQSLKKDVRIHVTGFVEHVQDVLKNANIFLCPWQGTYGFRSRLIEVMAIGLPVITTKDAIDGIDLEIGKGLFVAEEADEFAKIALDLLSDKTGLRNQSLAARNEVESKYSYEHTYVKGISEINKVYTAK